ASTGASSSTRAMSNANVDTATNRSRGPRASFGTTASSSAAMPPWVTVTALGRPVDPDVKMVTAGVDGGRSSTGPDRSTCAGSAARSTTGIGAAAGGGTGAPATPLSTTIAAAP